MSEQKSEVRQSRYSSNRDRFQEVRTRRKGTERTVPPVLPTPGVPVVPQDETLISRATTSLPLIPSTKKAAKPMICKVTFEPDGKPSELAPGIRPPQSPFISIDRNAGRPPRQIHWSFGIQREITPNLMVDVAYVGNRGVWWTAPLLATQNYNSLTPESLKAKSGRLGPVCDEFKSLSNGVEPNRETRKVPPPYT